MSILSIDRHKTTEKEPSENKRFNNKVKLKQKHHKLVYSALWEIE